jgi:hypothetical protein
MAEAALAPRMRSERRTMHGSAEELVRRYEALKTQRSTWDFDFQDIVRLLIPGADDIIELHDPGQSRTEHIFDGHPLRAPQTLAANMMSAITNQSLQWRRLKFRDEALNETQAVNGWLHACDTRIMAAYSSSNFYQAAHTYYLNLGGFGTAAMYAGSRLGTDGQHLHFKTLPTGSYVIAENADGLVDTLFRELWLTPRQALQMFGNECSERMREMARNNDLLDKQQKFLHCVYPRVDRDRERYDNQHMPYAGVYLELDQKHICDETGYQEFPYLVSRWETLSRAPYGYGPGHLALPDVRMLNSLRELHLTQLALWVRPPLKALQEGIIGNISLENNAVNVVRQMDALQTLDLTGRPDLVQIDQADLRRSIDDTFFVNALQALPPPDASNMTAYEVSQRIELMTRLMGPVFYRLLAEFLNPLEDRVFGIMWRAGALPPIPREVVLAAQQSQGQLDVDYDGPLARAQRGDDVQGIMSLMAATTQISTMQQSLDVIDNFEWDQIIRYLADVQGVPKAYKRDYSEVTKMRALRAQQAAQIQQAQMQNESLSAMGRVAPLIDTMQQMPQAA